MHFSNVHDTEEEKGLFVFIQLLVPFKICSAIPCSAHKLSQTRWGEGLNVKQNPP
jgi:hypothetical protein